MNARAGKTLLTPKLLSALVKSVRGAGRGARFIGVAAGGNWTGPRRLRVGDDEVAVVPCRSGLEVRLALAAPPEVAGPVVILTDREEGELGSDVLARLVKRRLLRPDPWNVVLELFAARSFDPRLRDEAWLASALIDAEPEGGYPRVPTGVLDADSAFGALLRARFGLGTSRPDATTLLAWTRSADLVARLVDAPEDLRSGVTAWLANSAGSVGAVMLRAVLGGRAGDAVPLGIALRVLFAAGTTSSPAAAAAVVRLETWLGPEPLAPADALAFADAAEELCRSPLRLGGEAELERVLTRADELLLELKASDEAWRSPWLPGGFEQRLRRFAASATAALEGTGPIDAVESLASEVRHHERAGRDPERVRIVRMAERLVRRVVTSRTSSPADTVRAYAEDGAFVDRARSVLARSDHEKALAALASRILERADADAEQAARTFARELAALTRSGTLPSGTIGIEDVLRTIVAPLAKSSRVLLIVMDGMSCPVYRDLVDDLEARGFLGIVPEGVTACPRVIAALPTLTSISRASLLAGRVATGPAAFEKEEFARNPDLLAVTGTARPPILHHKADLSAGVDALLDDAGPKVVAVVLNAVDDHLAKHDQLRLHWSLDAIPPLRNLIETASARKFAVVLTSDHGHVLDRGTTLRAHDTENARARPVGVPPADDEVLLEGARVQTANGRRVIAAWSDRVRFGPKQHGYHGGANPAEVVVPLGVFVKGEKVPKGWQPAANDRPAWWEPTLAPTASPAVAKGELFASRQWIDRLVESPTYRSQVKLAGRGAPQPEQLRTLIGALSERGGKLPRAALEHRLGFPPARLAPFLAAARRVLNVEGYDVLQVDDAEVVLDRDLLDQQFGI